MALEAVGSSPIFHPRYLHGKDLVYMAKSFLIYYGSLPVVPRRGVHPGMSSFRSPRTPNCLRCRSVRRCLAFSLITGCFACFLFPGLFTDVLHVPRDSALNVLRRCKSVLVLFALGKSPSTLTGWSGLTKYPSYAYIGFERCRALRVRLLLLLWLSDRMPGVVGADFCAI